MAAMLRRVAGLPAFAKRDVAGIGRLVPSLAQGARRAPAPRSYGGYAQESGAGADDGADAAEPTAVVYDAAFDPECRNAVVLTGRLGKDVEPRPLSSGNYVATLSLAVSGGRDKTYWFNVETYSPLTEQLQQRARRGTEVVVHGRLRMDQWVDKATGQKRSAVKVLADQVGIIPRRGPTEGSNQPDASGAAGSGWDQQAAAAPAAAAPWDAQPPPPPAAAAPWEQQGQGAAPWEQQAQQYGQQQQQQYGQPQYLATAPQQQAQYEQPQYEQPQFEPPDQQYAPAAPAAGAVDRLPLPPAPSNDGEALWLDVINNPSNWWDNRTNKRNPRAPDFKQRKGEAALWLTSRDTPVWVHSNLPPLRG